MNECIISPALMCYRNSNIVPERCQVGVPDPGETVPSEHRRQVNLQRGVDAGPTQDKEASEDHRSIKIVCSRSQSSPRQT